MKQNKTMAYIYLICMWLFSMTFEIFMFYFNNLTGEVLKAPIGFFLYSLALTMPICHRIMALIQPAHKNNVVFDIGKYAYNLYFCVLFVTTLYTNATFVKIRWFLYIFSIINIFYHIQKGNYDNTDGYSNAQYVLSFQLMSIIYCIMLMTLCNFIINYMTFFLIGIYIVCSNLIRVYILAKLNMFNNFKFVIRYIVSAVLEIVVFLLCLKLFPSENMIEFQKSLYEGPATLYVITIILMVVFILLEIPMYKIRNTLWNTFCKDVHIKKSDNCG